MAIMSHISHSWVISWVQGLLMSLEGIATVPNWEVTKMSKSSIFWPSLVLLSFFSQASTTTARVIVIAERHSISSMLSWKASQDWTYTRSMVGTPAYFTIIPGYMISTNSQRSLSIYPFLSQKCHLIVLGPSQHAYTQMCFCCTNNPTVFSFMECTNQLDYLFFFSVIKGIKIKCRKVVIFAVFANPKMVSLLQLFYCYMNAVLGYHQISYILQVLLLPGEGSCMMTILYI